MPHAARALSQAPQPFPDKVPVSPGHLLGSHEHALSLGIDGKSRSKMSADPLCLILKFPLGTLDRGKWPGLDPPPSIWSALAVAVLFLCARSGRLSLFGRPCPAGLHHPSGWWHRVCEPARPLRGATRPHSSVCPLGPHQSEALCSRQPGNQAAPETQPCRPSPRVTPKLLPPPSVWGALARLLFSKCQRSLLENLSGIGKPPSPGRPRHPAGTHLDLLAPPGGLSTVKVASRENTWLTTPLHITAKMK